MSAIAVERGWPAATAARPSSSDVTFEAGARPVGVRARTQRRRQDHPVPRPARRARAARRQRRGRAAAPGLRRADRPHPARLPGQRARRGADGRARARPLVAAAAARRARRRRARRSSASGSRTRPTSASASSRAASASARCSPARSCRTRPCCCSTSRCPASTPPARQLIERVFGELRAEGRTLLVATHDVESARSYDLVLCLNRRQVAFGAPAPTLDARDARGDLRPRADRARGRRAAP